MGARQAGSASERIVVYVVIVIVAAPHYAERIIIIIMHVMGAEPLAHCHNIDRKRERQRETMSPPPHLQRYIIIGNLGGWCVVAAKGRLQWKWSDCEMRNAAPTRAHRD